MDIAERLQQAILRAAHENGRRPDDRFETYASASEWAEWLLEALREDGLDIVPRTD